VPAAGSSAQAIEAASRAFEAFYGCPWKLHADSIEVIAADPNNAGQRTAIGARVVCDISGCISGD